MPSLQRRFKRYTEEERREYMKKKYPGPLPAPSAKKVFNENCIAIGDKLKKLRSEAGMSQRALAIRLRTYQCSISRIEAGKENLGIENLEKIAKIFNKKIKITLY